MFLIRCNFNNVHTSTQSFFELRNGQWGNCAHYASQLDFEDHDYGQCLTTYVTFCDEKIPHQTSSSILWTLIIFHL